MHTTRQSNSIAVLVCPACGTERFVDLEFVDTLARLKALESPDKEVRAALPYHAPCKTIMRMEALDAVKHPPVQWDRLSHEEQTALVIRHVLKEQPAGAFNPLHEMDDAWKLIDALPFEEVDVHLETSLQAERLKSYGCRLIAEGIDVKALGATHEESVCKAALLASGIVLQEENTTTQPLG